MRAGGAALCCWPQHSSSELSPELPAPRPVSEAGVGEADVSEAGVVVRAVVARRSWRSHTDLPALHAQQEQEVVSEEPPGRRRDVSKPVKESINEELRAARAYSFRLHEDRRGGPDLMDSGAGINQCISKLSTMSVEAVDYADATFYLRDSVTDVSGGDVAGDVVRDVAGDVVRDVAGDVSRCRVVSDGDILAPRGRPESGAFSESDVEWWSSPPARRCAGASHTETAI